LTNNALRAAKRNQLVVIARKSQRNLHGAPTSQSMVFVKQAALYGIFHLMQQLSRELSTSK
jgi:hypothetical protein